MLVPLRGWLLVVAGLVLAAVGFYRTYECLPLPLSADDHLRLELAERWAQKVSFELNRFSGRPSVTVARVIGDDQGILTAQLAKWISRRNVVLAETPWYDGLSYSTGLASEPSSIEEAIEPLLGHEIDFLVAAEVYNWTTYPEYDATLVGCLKVLNGDTGEKVSEYHLSLPQMTKVVEERPAHQASSAYLDSQSVNPESSVAKGSIVEESANIAVANTSAPRLLNSTVSSRMHFTGERNAVREDSAVGSEKQNTGAILPLIPGIAIWILVVSVLPPLNNKRLRRMLWRKNNSTNAITLASWVLLSFGTASMLWLFHFSWVPAISLGLAATAFACCYFGLYCQALEATR